MLPLAKPENVKLVVSVDQINNAIAERDGALVKANETIQTLQAEIESMKPFKEAAEKGRT